jgi:hypothetical protein
MNHLGLFPIIPFGALPAAYFSRFIAFCTVPANDFFLDVNHNVNGPRALLLQAPDIGGFFGRGIVLCGLDDNQRKETGVFPTLLVHFLRYVSGRVEEMGHCGYEHLLLFGVWFRLQM